MELDDVRPSAKVTEATIHANREPKVSVLHRLQRGIASSEDDVMDMEVVEEEEVPVKKQKVLERCKFWPVCKSGDECSYHHPTTQCKTFPSCKFGDKCLFVHPNCKYDARCSKPDCPFTHVSRRGCSCSSAQASRAAGAHLLVCVDFSQTARRWTVRFITPSRVVSQRSANEPDVPSTTRPRLCLREVP
ncbi:Zinc finger CCCH domain-containing protein 14 [Larimichthys crocea]|uniref:Uncharacterized protein n=1 Tax=Larimichthys crocea TaxID=215358 RepID=A0ACD3QY55_LARCR|nr:Zinc finger CCCH domain-containing protein 14 [Larimichthys crocea]